MSGAINGIVSVLTAIVAVAALSVIFSPRSQAANVARATFGGFADALKAAQFSMGGSGVSLGMP